MRSWTYIGAGLLPSASGPRCATGRRTSAIFAHTSLSPMNAPWQTSYFDGRFGELLANWPRGRDNPVIVLKSVDHGKSHGRDGDGHGANTPQVPRQRFLDLVLVPPVLSVLFPH